MEKDDEIQRLIAKDEEIKKIALENRKLAKENQEVVKKIYRHLKVARIAHIIYWAVIIASALGAYYFLQPYVERARVFYTDTQNEIRTLGGFIPGLSKFFGDDMASTTPSEE
jgi:hypothetical protein